MGVANILLKKIATYNPVTVNSRRPQCNVCDSTRQNGYPTEKWNSLSCLKLGCSKGQCS